MSLHLEFDPHSWYYDFAIRDNSAPDRKGGNYWSNIQPKRWTGYIENGNFYIIDTVEAGTLAELREQVVAYHLRNHTGHGERIAHRRLENIRASLLAESISYDELAELQSLSEYIADDDVELREAAGVPE